MKKAIERICGFAETNVFLIVCFLVAYGSIAVDLAAVGVCILLAVVTFLFVASDDFMLAIPPILMLACTYFVCTEETFLLFALIPAVLALLYRAVMNFRRLRGRRLYSLPGMIAVAVAVSLSGLFVLTPEEYFSPLPLLCTLCLGVAAVFVYLFVRGGMAVERRYNVKDRAAVSMYLAGLLFAFIILRLFLVEPELWKTESVGEMLSSIAWWRNGVATLLVMILPFITYFAVTHHPLHMLSAFFVYGAGVISGSRGMAVCGTVSLLVCCLYFVYYRRKWRIPFALALVAALVLAFVFRGAILDFCQHFLRFKLDIESLLREDRVKFLFRSIEDFLQHPLFGVGFGYRGNYDIHVLVVNWYHSLLPQIIGGSGIVGILAYGYQGYLRARLILAAPRKPFAWALILSYFGILIYSQIDPGLSSPFALVAVILFALLEEEAYPKPLCKRKEKVTETAAQVA